MVYIHERPVPAREAEGRLGFARLFQWIQFSQHVPTTLESRLLMLGMDEMFQRTVDMTFIASALAIRTATLWIPMRFAARWALPVYGGLVVADRRRAMNVRKIDSTWATLIALAKVDTPLGREALRMTEQSKLRLAEFDRTDHGRALMHETRTYMSQVFLFYDLFGKFVGPVVTHLMLWATLHSMFEGTAVMHKVSSSSSSTPFGEPQSAAQVLRRQEQEQKAGGKVPSVPAAFGTGQSSKSRKQKGTGVELSTIWLCYQINLRWIRWQLFEMSSAAAPTPDAEDNVTVAFTISLPAHDHRNDFVANEMRKTQGVVMRSTWFPSRAWWWARLLFVGENPPTPGFSAA